MNKFENDLLKGKLTRATLIGNLCRITPDIIWEPTAGTAFHNIYKNPKEKANRNTASGRLGAEKENNMGYSLTAYIRNTQKCRIVEARIGVSHFTSTYIKGISKKNDESKDCIFDGVIFLITNNENPTKYGLYEYNDIPQNRIKRHIKGQGNATRLNISFPITPISIYGDASLFGKSFPSLNEAMVDIILRKHK